MPANEATSHLDCSEPGTLLRRSIYPDSAEPAATEFPKKQQMQLFFYKQATANQQPCCYPAAMKSLSVINTY